MVLSQDQRKRFLWVAAQSIAELQKAGLLRTVQASETSEASGLGKGVEMTLSSKFLVV